MMIVGDHLKWIHPLVVVAVLKSQQIMKQMLYLEQILIHCEDFLF